MPTCERVRVEMLYFWFAKEPCGRMPQFPWPYPTQVPKAAHFPYLSPALPLWAVSLGEISLLPEQQTLSTHDAIKTTLQKVPLMTSTELRRIQIPVLSTIINKHLEYKKCIKGTWLCHQKNPTMIF